MIRMTLKPEFVASLVAYVRGTPAGMDSRAAHWIDYLLENGHNAYVLSCRRAPVSRGQSWRGPSFYVDKTRYAIVCNAVRLFMRDHGVEPQPVGPNRTLVWTCGGRPVRILLRTEP